MSVSAALESNSRKWICDERMWSSAVCMCSCRENQKCQESVVLDGSEMIVARV